jgi:hypothetical protein
MFYGVQNMEGFTIRMNNVLVKQYDQKISKPLNMSLLPLKSRTKYNRRDILFEFVTAVTTTIPIVEILQPQPVCAMVERSSTTMTIAATPATEDTIWMTGKMPQIPGQKPKDKNDVSGTRKDPNFLRSLSDCKNQCENTGSIGGYAKSKDECLSECQDICCTTYQQCTFPIVQRI